jgi:hypothetical protein
MGLLRCYSQTEIPIYIGAGFVNALKGYNEFRYGANPWWSAAVGSGVSLSSNTFLMLKFHFSYHHEENFVNGVESTDQISYSWAHTSMSLGPMYKLPIPGLFDINFQAGLSWVNLFRYNDGEITEGEEFFPLFVGLGLERPTGNKSLSIFVETDYQGMTVNTSNKTYTSLTTIAGFRYYIGHE